MLAVLIWAFTFAWGWNESREAAKRDAQLAHDLAVQNCIAINELMRKLYVTAVDLDLDPVATARFLPSRRCEFLP